jgi:hypothetical protein
MNKAYLFYGNQLVAEIDHQSGTSLGRRIKADHGQEIYDGGWVYAPWYSGRPYEWWRCDMTPCFIEHVPLELRVLALLLT